MSSEIREFHRPEALAQAARLLADAAAPAAPLLRAPRIPNPPFEGAAVVVDLSRLGLDQVREEDGSLKLGALVTLQALAEADLFRSLAGGLLAQAAELAAAAGLRRLATVGGAVAGPGWREGPPEVLLALLALGAELVFAVDAASGTGSVVPLAEYLQPGYAAPAAVLREVRIARPGARARGALARVARTPRDQAIAAALAVVDGAQVRLAVAAGGVPQLIELPAGFAARALHTVDDLVEQQVRPVADFRASLEYRREMAGVLARRALGKAL